MVKFNAGKYGNGNAGKTFVKEDAPNNISVDTTAEEFLFEVKKARKAMPVYTVHYISCAEIIQGITRILTEDNGFGKDKGYSGCHLQYNPETKSPEIYVLWNTKTCPLIESTNSGRSFKNMAPAAAALLQSSGAGNQVSFDAYALLTAMNGLFVNYEDGEHKSVRYIYDPKSGIVGYKIDIKATLMAIHRIDPTGTPAEDGSIKYLDITEFHRKDKAIDSYFEYYTTDLALAEHIQLKYNAQFNNNNKNGNKPKFNAAF